MTYSGSRPPGYTYTDDRLKMTPMPDANLGTMSDSGGSDGVNTPNNAYFQMARYWEVVEAVKEGTVGLRDGRETFLPKEPFEKDPAYERRLSRSCFAPWYVRLREAVVGQILRKPIVFEDISTDTESHLDNINLLGDDVNSFARGVLQSGIDQGHSAIFVDYPKAEGLITLAQQREAGLRPYWLHYKASDLIGWRSQIVRDQQILTQVRIREAATVPDGEFGERIAERVKVFDLVSVDLDNGGTLQRCRYRVFERSQDEEDKDRFVQIAQGIISMPYIPIAIIYTNRTGFLTSKPPMLEIAYLNLKHYQLSSDLDHSLHLAANPKLVLYGYDTGQGDVNVGVDEALVFDNPDGKAEWIAAPTESFAAQERRIKEIEQQMATLAISAMTSQKNVGESAEAKRLDRVQSDSMLSVLSQSLQDALDLCLQFHADYLQETAGTCQVNKDFQVTELTAQEITAFSQLQQLDQISLQTFLELLQRGEILPEEFDVQEELDRLARAQLEEEVLFNGTDGEVPSGRPAPESGGIEQTGLDQNQGLEESNDNGEPRT